jgi:hypothetical protein
MKDVERSGKRGGHSYEKDSTRLAAGERMNSALLDSMRRVGGKLRVGYVTVERFVAPTQ